jgi:preprotein translocase subunit SecE
LVNRDARFVAAAPQSSPQRERLPSDRRGAISALNPKSGLIVVRALEGPGGGPMSPNSATIIRFRHVAKTSPMEFIRQVQAETRKVVWPSRRETVMTGVMVMIMTVILAVFFFAIDKVFDMGVEFLLSLAK